MARNRFVLALTGASGMPYGLRLLECLLQRGQGVDLLISSAARVVLRMETELELPATPAGTRDYLLDRFGGASEQLRVYGQDQWSAPIASGSSAPRAMVVCPCTSGTLAAIAMGNSDSLLERAADVVLKERRPLLLVHREMPVSAIHIEHMLKLARLDVTIMPASPGFYHRPESVDDLIDFVVARILDHLGVDHDLLPRWGDAPNENGHGA